MKSTIWMVGLALAASLATAAAAAGGADLSGQQRAQAAGRAMIGAPAPRLVLTTIDGDTIDLGGLYGRKAVYLKFWATWCVPCRQQMPHFEHVYETAGPDMAVIAVDVGFNDSIQAIREYRKKLGITMPIVFDDGRLGAAFHIRVTPTHIVIGRDGRIEYIGHLADDALDGALVAARSPHASDASRSAREAPRRITAKAADNTDPPAIGVGDQLPPWSLRTLDGRRVELRQSGSEAQLTALVFLSPWCESYLESTRPEVSADCRAAREQIGGLAANPHLHWLGIASGLWASREDLRKYSTTYHVSIPLTLDESGMEFRAFRVNDVPTIFLADGTGKILRRIDGAAMRKPGSLKKAIDDVGGGG